MSNANVSEIFTVNLSIIFLFIIIAFTVGRSVWHRFNAEPLESYLHYKGWIFEDPNASTSKKPLLKIVLVILDEIPKELN
mgnify:CR=1 FL=1